MSGDVASASLSYIVRDHDREKFRQRKQYLTLIVDQMNERYGTGTVELILKDQYYNMKEKIKPCMHLIENAKGAAESVEITPKVQPIRGGTDGARLSFMGLPCPNLGTGGFAFHGPYEHVTVEGMDLAVQMLLEIIRRYATACESE